jgi:hypothetical protein
MYAAHAVANAKMPTRRRNFQAISLGFPVATTPRTPPASE